MVAGEIACIIEMKRSAGIYKQPPCPAHPSMFLLLSPALRGAVFARLFLSELDNMFRTSRACRDAVRTHVAVRRRLARLMFENLADFWERVPYDAIGDTFISRCAVRQEAGVVHVAYRNEVRVGRIRVFENTIRMQIRLVADRVDIQVRDSRVVRIPLPHHLDVPDRIDTFVIRPGMDRIESCRNGVVGPLIPVPQGMGLFAYVCEAMVGSLEEELN
jgi:hypothetical protein